MKKNILLIVTGIFLLTGCESFLDKTPVSDLAPGNYFKDKAEMKNWNAGIYSSFQSALSRGQVIWGEVRSDNVHTTTYATAWIYMNALMASKDEASWEDLYQCISRCNIGIEKYPTIPNILESEYAPYIGQCYGMRAYMYFWGTRVWGKMPLITETWDGDLKTLNVPRASLEEVKGQILNDIEMALTFLGTDVSDKYYINRATMYALLTDFYMWYHEYDKALESSDYFINNNSFVLAQGETEWKDIFTNPANSKEVIFTMHWNFAKNKANSGWPGQLGASNTNNGFQISQAIFEEFIDRLRSDDGADSRLWNTLDTVKLYYNNSRLPLTYATYSASGIQKCIKYSDVDPDREYDNVNEVYKSHYRVLNTTDSEQQLVMYRLGNIMFLRAEALNQLGRGDEALDLVNRMRQRVGYLKDAKDEVDGVNDKYGIESVILGERQLELYGEGCRWFDLMRTGRLVEVMDKVYSARQEAAGVTITGFGHEGTKYWPVYYREFESDGALAGDQNPPYAER
ncbi:MAG: RagB/SusD family nutrient uptake outer membrane protein [Tannerella sp.]|jgi:hypothetical protein|nr:RagB/SusD family nutrient uptake outer membrane protein [Tannerella sp.]